MSEMRINTPSIVKRASIFALSIVMFVGLSGGFAVQPDASVAGACGTHGNCLVGADIR